MKKLLVFILLLFPALLSAQTTSRLINRIDEQSSVFIRHEIQTSQGTAKSFKFVLQDSTVTGPQGGAPELAGTITNTTSMPVKIIFERTHLRMDTNVSSGICLCSCYTDNLDTLPSTSACPLDAGIPNWNFLFHPHTVYGHTLSGPDSIVDYIKLTSLSGDPGDTISFIVKGILMPSDGVFQQKKNSSTPQITSIYPSPLVQGSAIKVKISSPRESNLSYSIYDALGRVVALGVTRQHIGIGENTIGIASLDGLGNGSYMLKLNFADGSSDTHFFQVMR